MENNDFRSDLTDISAKTKPLVTVYAPPRVRLGVIVSEPLRRYAQCSVDMPYQVLISFLYLHLIILSSFDEIY